MDATDRTIVRLAVPALGSLAVEPLYVLVDTAIVGRLGTAQLGGLALAATVLTFVTAGCNFLSYGTTQRLARRLGGNDPAGAADVGVQAMWLASIVALVARETGMPVGTTQFLTDEAPRALLDDDPVPRFPTGQRHRRRGLLRRR